MNDFGFYFKIGWEHIISWDALDHLLFVAALAAVFMLKNWKQVLILITAFTLGHAITLVLSTLNIIEIPSRIIEILIPITIMITAVSNFFIHHYDKKNISINYSLAFFFGLVHGLGFASTLQFMLASDQSLGWALFGFNVGVEAGQILVVFLVLLLAQFFIVMLKLKRQLWVNSVSVLVLGFAFYMLLNRLLNDNF